MKKNKKYIATINSLKKLNDDFYYLDYYLDYDLDNVIDANKKGAVSYFLKFRKAIKKKIHFACSTFDAHNEQNEHLLGRNYDYRNSPAIIINIHSSKGYQSICMSDLNFLFAGYNRKIEKHKKNLINAPYVVMDGMNDQGLAIAVLELHHTPTKQNDNNGFINTTLAIRYILDKCENIPEAISFLKNKSMRALLGYDYHFQIIDKNDSVVVEYINNKIEIIPKNDEYQCLTNHYISNKIKKDRVIIKSEGKMIETSGEDRIKLIKETLDKNNGILSNQEAMKLLYDVRQHYYFVLKHTLRYYVDTIYSAIYNVSDLSLTVSRNNHEFTFKLK